MTLASFLTSFILVCLLAATDSNRSGSEKPAIGLIAREQLTTTVNHPEPPANDDLLPTYLRDRGVRSLFNAFGGNLSLVAIQKLVQEPLFLKGPHLKGKIDCESQAQFGIYNPVAVEQLVAVCKQLSSDTVFIATTQEAYDSHLQRLVRTYYEAALVCQANPQWLKVARAEYLERVDRQAASFFEFGIDRQFGDFAEAQLDLDWYEANTAVGFWLRRSIDQSGPHFFSAVEYLLQAYDPAYLDDRTQNPEFTFGGHQFLDGE